MRIHLHAVRHGIPVSAMMTFTEVGKTMMGNSVQDFVEGMREFPLTAVGLNCSLGPERAVPVIAAFRQYTDLPLMFKPNAGKPVSQGDGTTVEYTADIFVEDSLPALDADVTYIGGCADVCAGWGTACDAARRRRNRKIRRIVQKRNKTGMCAMWDNKS